MQASARARKINREALGFYLCLLALFLYFLVPVQHIWAHNLLGSIADDSILIHNLNSSEILKVSLITNVDDSPKQKFDNSSDLHPSPSTDTTPIISKVVNVYYKIPRNYIVYQNIGFPVLKVTYPGFKPLTDETRECFSHSIKSPRRICTTLELILGGSGGPVHSHADMFTNFIKNFPSIKPRGDEFGYKIYDLGPVESRTENFRREKDDLYFSCNRFGEILVKGASFCFDMVFLGDGNTVQFSFNYDRVQDVAEMEDGIRDLMSNFVINGVAK
jgi:hypothetical protein